jgi:hypothetical protein
MWRILWNSILKSVYSDSNNTTLNGDELFQIWKTHYSRTWQVKVGWVVFAVLRIILVSMDLSWRGLYLMRCHAFEVHIIHQISGVESSNENILRWCLSYCPDNSWVYWLSLYISIISLLKALASSWFLFYGYRPLWVKRHEPSKEVTFQKKKIYLDSYVRARLFWSWDRSWILFKSCK